MAATITIDHERTIWSWLLVGLAACAALVPAAGAYVALADSDDGPTSVSRQPVAEEQVYGSADALERAAAASGGAVVGSAAAVGLDTAPRIGEPSFGSADSFERRGR